MVKTTLYERQQKSHRCTEQIIVKALFYLENSRRIHPRSPRVCQPKDAKRREWRSTPAHGEQSGGWGERKSVCFGSSFYVFSRKCTGHSKHPLPKTQEKTLHMDITRWSTPKSDWLYSLQPKMEKLYTVNKNKTRSWLWLRLWNPYCQTQTEIEESRENH